MTVVAMPVTIVCGSPALNVSTVVSRQGTPALARIRSTTCCAVSSAAEYAERAEWAWGHAETPVQSSAAAPAVTKSLLDGSCGWLAMPCLLPSTFYLLPSTFYEPDLAVSLVERYSALNSSGNVACVW